MAKRNKTGHTKLIVLTSTLPRWDGDAVPSFVLDHARLLRENIDDVVVIAPHAKGAKRSELIDGVRVKRVRYWFPEGAQDLFYEGGAGEKKKSNPLYYFKVLSYIISVTMAVIREKPKKGTIVNANWVIPQGIVGGFIRVLNSGIQLVTTARGGDIYTINSPLMVKVKKWVLSKSDVVVVNSSDMAKRCTAIYKREYIVQPTGFDDAKLKKKSYKQYREQAEEPLKLMTAGRLIEGKGFLDILEAVNRVNTLDKNKRIKLNIAGEGPLRNEIEDYIRLHKMSDHVHMLGWLGAEEMRDAYHNCDAYIGAPKAAADGWREAFGNVYAEAMACGNPVIVTTDAGASEIVNNGVSGLVVDPGDIDMLAEAICILRDNPTMARKMGQAAAKAAAPYSKVATRNKYIEIIHELQK